MKYTCPSCDENIGYLGTFFQWLTFGRWHICDVRHNRKAFRQFLEPYVKPGQTLSDEDVQMIQDAMFRHAYFDEAMDEISVHEKDISHLVTDAEWRTPNV